MAQAYGFLVEHHQPGDRIFLFGFSRGAFTVRAVAGLIHLCGLMERGHENLVPALLQTYRAHRAFKRPLECPTRARLVADAGPGKPRWSEFGS